MVCKVHAKLTLQVGSVLSIPPNPSHVKKSGQTGP